MLPGVLLQGMTAVEIHWITGNAGISVKGNLERLTAKGFGSISGGAEIFHPGCAQKGRDNKDFSAALVRCSP